MTKLATLDEFAWQSESSLTHLPTNATSRSTRGARILIQATSTGSIRMANTIGRAFSTACWFEPSATCGGAEVTDTDDRTIVTPDK